MAVLSAALAWAHKNIVEFDQAADFSKYKKLRHSRRAIEQPDLHLHYHLRLVRQAEIETYPADWRRFGTR